MGTPPNAVIFGSDRLRSGEWVRGGAGVTLTAVFIAPGFCPQLLPMIFDLDAGKFPAWAARPQALNAAIPSLRPAPFP